MIGSRSSLARLGLLVLAFTSDPRVWAAALNLDQVRDRLRSTETTRIVCFGDSITGAYYHSGGVRAWCDALGIGLKQAIPDARLEMINAGISGHTTVDALARLSRDVIDREPHLVVIMFGMNDVTRVPVEQYSGNLEAIIARCHDAGAAVIVCSPNSVVENGARPNAKLAEYSTAARDVAGKAGVEFVDILAEWTSARERDEPTWRLWMSDEIHPNMNGHRRFAELIGSRIIGVPVSLARWSPPADAFRHVAQKLMAGEAVHIVAMPPHGESFAKALRSRFPSAELRITEWPVEQRTVAQLREWAGRIRSLQPDLVIPAVPADAQSPDDATYIRDYEWILNFAFPFAGRAWDVVPILPLGTDQPSAGLADRRGLARMIIVGKDVEFIERLAEESRDPNEIVLGWVRDHLMAVPSR